MKQNRFISLLILFLFLQTRLISQDWHSIGPPSNPLSLCISSDYLLIGTQQSGIARSTDSGLTWKYVDGLPSLGYGTLPSYTITCIKHDPINQQIVYAGIGPNETASGHGLYRSTNGGITWTQKSNGLPMSSAVTNIAINPFHSNEIYICDRVSSGMGIYRSTNFGESWSLFFQDTYIISTLIFDRNDSTNQYAIGIDGTVHRWNSGTYSRISSTTYLSTSFPIFSFLNEQTHSLFYIYDSKIYRWKSSTSWISLLPNVKAAVDSISVIYCADIDQDHGVIILCTDRGVLRSQDDGNSWTNISEWTNMTLCCDSGRIIAVGFSGVYLSSNMGDTWLRTADGPNISSVSQISIAYSILGNVIYTIADNCVMKSTNNGLAWTKLQIPNNPPPTVIRANPFNTNTLYLGCGAFYTSNLGLYKSLDGGTTWNQMLPDSSIPVTAIDIPSNDTGRILLGTPGRVWQSTNSGSSWECLLWIDLGNTHEEINCVQIAKSNPSTIFAGVSSNSATDAGIFMTTDSGAYWEQRNNGLPEALEYTNISAIAIHPANDNIVYIGNSAGIFKSTNQGLNWIGTSFPSCLNIGYVNDIQFASDNPNLMFATIHGTQVGTGGLFYSYDGGITWGETIFSGLYDKSRTFIKILPLDTNYNVYVGTLSYGWYVGTLSRYVTSVASNRILPVSIILDQNYPNPFNPMTTIGFSIPSKSFVSLKVFDLIGREVATIVSEEIPAGNYTKQWNAANISSGVYFYRLQTSSFSDTKKLILLR